MYYLYSTFSAGGFGWSAARKFLRVKGVKITDEFEGKANETGNSKLCLHPNDSHRFGFSLFTVVLVHKYLQSKNGRNLVRARDLSHEVCDKLE